MKENGEKFRDYTPDMMVEYQKQADNGSRYEILDMVQRYIGTLNGRTSAKKTNYATLKSFFMHSRAELPKDPAFNIRGDTPKVVGKLTIENIRDMVNASSRLYRAVYLAMFQGGMDGEGIVFWSNNGYKDLLEQLRKDPETIKIQLPGRKKRRNEYPFTTMIGPDAIQALREWLEIRPADAESIFTNQYGVPLTKRSITQNWLRHLHKMGLINIKQDGRTKATRYGFNLHEVRDLFRTQYEKSPGKGSAAEYMMGHRVDPLEYNKACEDERWLRGEYLKALPLLQIMSSGVPFGMVPEEEADQRTVDLEAKYAQLEAKLDRLLSKTL